MIMGDTCTRACTFCNVKTGKPNYLDPHEPERVAISVNELGLTHVVITSVNRDDLKDNGLLHFLNTIKAIRQQSPKTTIEILTPDFLKNNRLLILLGNLHLMFLIITLKLYQGCIMKLGQVLDILHH